MFNSLSQHEYTKIHINFFSVWYDSLKVCEKPYKKPKLFYQIFSSQISFFYFSYQQGTCASCDVKAVFKGHSLTVAKQRTRHNLITS